MTTVIDCTFRDGGYYNAWDFSPELVTDYLHAMKAASVDYVEIGFRALGGKGFRGAFAYSSDDFLRTLNIPEGIKLGVMMNGADLVKHPLGPLAAAQSLFSAKADSPVTLVRFAVHLHEFVPLLEVCKWLKEQGYVVGLNLMQIADRSDEEIEGIAKSASEYPLDALYFADSMGGMDPTQTARIINVLKRYWHGALGIHTHDNMSNALANTMGAVDEGVTWLDATVTGMGRGPGNAKTEYLLAELKARGRKDVNITPLLGLIHKYFHPMQAKYGWGTNTYYYLAGKYSIHPTYIQEMLSDSRYSDADILSVIEHLRTVGGSKFSFSNLETGRAFFQGPPKGTWTPKTAIQGREVLVIATGSSNLRYKRDIESYIKSRKPYVIALNLAQHIDEHLIDARAACHPVRLLADCLNYARLPQPLICPQSMLPKEVLTGLGEKELLDFGLGIASGEFCFNGTSATIPTGLVIAYALAVATCGEAAKISIVGIDGYSPDDPRNVEMDDLLSVYLQTEGARPVQAITPSRYRIPAGSIYQLND